MVKQNRTFPEKSKTTGFTLLEILIAVIIFAIIIIGAQQVFSMATRNAAAVNAQQARLRQINSSLQILEKDVSQIISRSIRGPGFGFNIAALQSDISDNFIFKLTRGGWKNPLYKARPEIQAVTYHLDDDKLVRSYTPYLDALNEASEIERIILDQVLSIEVKYLSRQIEWLDDWPPINSFSNPQTEANSTDTQLTAPPEMPLAIEILIELEDYGVIRRLINLPPAA